MSMLLVVVIRHYPQNIIAVLLDTDHIIAVLLDTYHTVMPVVNIYSAVFIVLGSLVLPLLYFVVELSCNFLLSS